MEFSGQALIPAAPEIVWSALFDPDILKMCIPGCRRVERNADGTYAITMAVKVGPLQASFGGTIVLRDLDYSRGVTLSGSLQSGASGFAKGETRISLRENDRGTALDYRAEMRIGGKLATVGDRLFGSAVKRNIDHFFAALEGRFSNILPDAGTPESLSSEPS